KEERGIDLIVLAAPHDLAAVDLNRYALAAVCWQAMEAWRHGANPPVGSEPAQLCKRKISPRVFSACVRAVNRDVRDPQIMIDGGIARIDREELRRRIVRSARPLVALARLEWRRRRDEGEPALRQRLRQRVKRHVRIARPSVGRLIAQRLVIAANSLQILDRRVVRGSKAELATILAHGPHRAAVTRISTILAGDCSRASMHARAGAQPCGTHASQTLFISSTVRMSCSQIVACRSFDLSVPALARSPSMAARISCVCAPTLWPPVLSGVSPAR